MGVLDLAWMLQINQASIKHLYVPNRSIINAFTDGEQYMIKLMTNNKPVAITKMSTGRFLNCLNIAPIPIPKRKMKS